MRRSWQEPSHPEKKSFEELAAIYAFRDDSNWPTARNCLVEERKIPRPLVDELHARGSIYANDHRPNPSLVFLHRDQHGKVRGATLRDTKHQSVFRPCLGDKLTAWFVVGDLAKANRIAAVESPIDALSYYVLFVAMVPERERGAFVARLREIFDFNEDDPKSTEPSPIVGPH